MTRLGYLWIFLSVAVALYTVAHESIARDDAIRSATRSALVAGLEHGCDANNDLRNELVRTTLKLHPGKDGIVRNGLKPAPCAKDAEDFAQKYLQAKP